jgi:dihydroorotate dehydrogenase
MTLINSLYPYFKNIVFRFDPEKVHELTIKSMHKSGPFLKTKSDEFDFKVKSMGLHFKSPVGLAAGLDKNGEAIDFLTWLPFGFIEIGTITPRPQEGNDLPRLFRYPEIESLRNRMGFNNLGADLILKHLKKANRRGKIIGANLGKNKLTKNEEAHLDYAYLYRQFVDESDYLVINVSSPNTPGLRDLLNESGLKEIFEATSIERAKKSKPLLVKVSPDMTFEQLDSVVDLVLKYKLTGIIATNTTIDKSFGEGGMSGKILFEKARATREHLLKKCIDHPEIELIGVGGFSSFSEIKDYWIKGGKLVQLYSSFIFKGPLILDEIEKELKLDFLKYRVETFDDYLHAIRK